MAAAAAAAVCPHLAGGLQRPFLKSPCDDHIMMPCDHSLSTMNHRRRKQLGWSCGGGVRARASSSASTLYDLLAVPRGVNLAEIKSAYRQMAKVYHPDVCPPANRADSCHKFLAVQEAYETLSDPRLRALYDERLFNKYSHCSGVPRGHMAWEDQLLNLRSMQYRRGDSWGSRMRRFNQRRV